MPAEDFDRMRQPESLVDFFARSPLSGSGIDLKRKPDCGHKIDV